MCKKIVWGKILCEVIFFFCQFLNQQHLTYNITVVCSIENTKIPTKRQTQHKLAILKCKTSCLDCKAGSFCIIEVWRYIGWKVCNRIVWWGMFSRQLWKWKWIACCDVLFDSCESELCDEVCFLGSYESESELPDEVCFANSNNCRSVHTGSGTMDVIYPPESLETCNFGPQDCYILWELVHTFLQYVCCTYVINMQITLQIQNYCYSVPGSQTPHRAREEAIMSQTNSQSLHLPKAPESLLHASMLTALSQIPPL